MPCLNAQPFLEERMDSILNQTMQDWELIVCDSHSDDGSWEFLQKFRGDRRVRLYEVPREGPDAGYNRCIRQAKGEYVYVTPADDSAERDLLECLLVPLTRLPEIDIAVCDYEIIDEKGQKLPRARRCSDVLGEWVKRPSVRSGKAECLFHLCCGFIWCNVNTMLSRRQLFDRIGLFPTTYLSFGDLHWSLRASLASDVGWVPRALALYRYHGHQVTPRPFAARHHRVQLRIFGDVLRSVESRVPAAWKAMPQWKGRLLACARARYRLSLNLDRKNALRHPREFWGHVLEAAWVDPRWFGGWLRRGFRYTGADWMKYHAYAYELVKYFDAPWPPAEIEGGW